MNIFANHIEQLKAVVQDRISAAQKSLEEAQGQMDALQNFEALLPGISSKGKKISAKAKAKKVTKGSAKTTKRKVSVNATTGLEAVARGDRPPLKKAIVLVLGKKTMNSAQIVEVLKVKKWMPASSDPRQYVSYTLSSNTPDIFERTEKRGFYRVRDSAEVSPKNGNGNGNGKKPRAKGLAKAKVVKPDPKVDAQLADLYGINTNVASDPFKEAGVE